MPIDIVGRPAYGDKAMIVVPKLEKQSLWASLIAPGSSMVAFRIAGEKTLVIYFEGNIYEAHNLRTFRDRAICAYGRLAMQYPTCAMCADTTDGLEVVGTIKPDECVIHQSEAYLAWVALDNTLEQAS